MLTKEQATNRTDPRTQRSRQMLLDAFRELLTEKTFDSITVQDICERAALNRATFYKHFEDKYVLMDHSIQQMIQTSFDERLPPPVALHSDNLLLLISTVCEFVDFLRPHCTPSHQSKFDTLVEKRVQEYTRNIVLDWLVDGIAENSADYRQAELQATVTSWAIYGAAQKWQDTPDHEPAHDYAYRVYPLILPNIGIAEE